MASPSAQSTSFAISGFSFRNFGACYIPLERYGKYLSKDILHAPKFQKLKPKMAKEVDCADRRADSGQAGRQGWQMASQTGKKSYPMVNYRKLNVTGHPKGLQMWTLDVRMGRWTSERPDNLGPLHVRAKFATPILYAIDNLKIMIFFLHIHNH